MPCLASSETIYKQRTAQNKGSQTNKQRSNGRRKYHKKNHSPRIQTRIVQSLRDVNKGDVEIQQVFNIVDAQTPIPLLVKITAQFSSQIQPQQESRSKDRNTTTS